MTLILYIIMFSAVCFWRKRTLSGAHLKERLHDNGREYLEALQKYGKKHNKRIAATLGLAIGDVHGFAVRREKWYHRFLKSMGLAEEIHTGNEVMDDSLFFVTETPEDFHGVISRPGVLEAVNKLFVDFRVKELRCFNGRIWVTCPAVDIGSYTAEFASARLETLGTIANAAEAAQTSLRPQGLMTRGRIAAFCMMVHAALFMLGIFGGLPLFLQSVEIVIVKDLITMGAVLSFIFSMIWLSGIVMALGRSSWLPMVGADFVLMGIIGLFLSMTFTLREINMDFDRSEAVSHQKAIVAKTCELTCTRGSGKRRKTSTYDLMGPECAQTGRSAAIDRYRQVDSKCNNSAYLEYSLEVEPWLPRQKENFSFSVSEADFDMVKTGDKMDIPARKGALGLEWVDPEEIRRAP